MNDTARQPDPIALDLRFATRNVTAEEAAAVTAVLVQAIAEGDPEPVPERRSEWSHPRNAVRSPIVVGPGRWVASAR
ncbi:acyl-CoA carboxylase epsilon subunit [Agromyces marinus]|uniref:Acyl-CoA carboxylase subunit epsilon n=1 Tax=Agromyces marinus TaxID=1389020 RepID=A0ABM8GZ90_9MICO|nr:acyl-CoA carboxylase epsilon subunit [Agromyces marinus]UIP58009.1 hypothetical protein DSM26151_08790 [Agromyces marinus]BDZ53783.1 hypothetical protein GCM10025870_08560 [Agromyces marinus]